MSSLDSQYAMSLTTWLSTILQRPKQILIGLGYCLLAAFWRDPINARFKKQHSASRLPRFV